jgi:hypothetical protein
VGNAKRYSAEKYGHGARVARRPAAASSGRADLIVSGDNDLLALNTVHGVPIVMPATFISIR